MVVLGYPMLHTKFQGHWSTGSGEEGFYHIWAWWPYWSCEGLYKFLFPQPMSHCCIGILWPVTEPKEALKEIWLHLAQWGIGGVDVYRFLVLACVAILFIGAERF